MRCTRGSSLMLALATTALCLPVRLSAQVARDTAYANGRGDITMALAGDAIITRRLSVYDEPRFLGLRDLVRGATVGFVNLEMLFHDYGPNLIPAAQSGGTYMRADPRLARELVWMGFDMVSRANNHAMDFGVGGLHATNRALDAVGLVYAGTGDNLAEARAPAYLETRGGRVALISVASTFADFGRAGAQRGDMRGRPGLSPLRHTTTYDVPASALSALRGVADSLGTGPARARRRAGRLRFLGRSFRASTHYGVETAPDSTDLAQILAEVRAAKRQANWVIVSSHTHESGARRDVPPEFLVTFAHDAIDAGADVVLAEGPHILRGIEIYHGRPIFYSLANFIFENETVARQPADSYAAWGLSDDDLPADLYDRRNASPGWPFTSDSTYWQSVLAVPRFQDHRLVEIRLYPITLGYGEPRPERGRPLLATRGHARAILDRLQRLSRPYGTTIQDVDGVGVIRPAIGAAGRKPPARR